MHLGQFCCHSFKDAYADGRARQDLNSRPREDGTYVVEFRTAAGERLAISVPETKATVLKHFQAATAEPHAPIPGSGRNDWHSEARDKERPTDWLDGRSGNS